MPGEFDRYSQSYEDLLKDPLRDRFGAGGSAFFHERKAILLRDFLSRRHVPRGSWDYLDVGCGRGDLLRLLQPEFRSCAGCDPSPGMLADAAGVQSRLQDDPGRLPFPDRQFDLVSAVCVFHHVPPSARPGLLAEMRRVLRPGGICCLIEHNPWNPATQAIVRRTPVDADAQLLTCGAASRLLAAANLPVVEREYFLYLPEKLYRRFGRWETFGKALPFGGQYAIFAERR